LAVLLITLIDFTGCCKRVGGVSVGHGYQQCAKQTHDVFGDLCLYA